MNGVELTYNKFQNVKDIKKSMFKISSTLTLVKS